MEIWVLVSYRGETTEELLNDFYCAADDYM